MPADFGYPYCHVICQKRYIMWPLAPLTKDNSISLLLSVQVV